MNVGWLDGVHPFAKGLVEPLLVKKIKLLAAKSVALGFGKHLCEVCVVPPGVVRTYVLVMNDIRMIDPECSWAKWVAPRLGNGEIWVAGDGITFVAPVLIVHYIEEHGYLPPAQFLEAVARMR